MKFYLPRIPPTLLFLVQIHECVLREDLNHNFSYDIQSNSASPIETSDCSNLLSRSQRRFCRSHPMHLWLMSQGTSQALRICKNIFENSRWNCYSVETGPAGLTHRLKEGSREASFVEAFSAASMTAALARACADGSLSDCPCERAWQAKPPPRSTDHKWGGCSIDVRTPMRFVKKLLDIDLMNLQYPSTKAIKIVRKPDCRCHGTSGSCTFKTCYKRFGTFEDISRHLLKSYQNARHVYLNDSKSWIEVEKRPHSVNSLEENRALVKRKRHRRRNAKKRIKRKELIFTSDHTDYCNYDPAQGSLGTSKRRCSKENAEYLCCGRGYIEKFEIKREFCNCRFVNGCCNLVCKTCYTPVQFGICN